MIAFSLFVHESTIQLHIKMNKGFALMPNRTWALWEDVPLKTAGIQL